MVYSCIGFSFVCKLVMGYASVCEINVRGVVDWVMAEAEAEAEAE